MRRVLVAGIGNVFCGDDGFGVAVAAKLREREWPADVSVVDFGIRGLDLAYALMDEPSDAILIDAMPRGGAPGTLYVIEPIVDESQSAPQTHGMDPAKVLAMVRAATGRLPRLRIVGCEPESGEPGMGLSEPVRAAIDRACEIVQGLVAEAGHA